MITPEDFGFTPEELDYLVTGAQEYLAPEPDVTDEERLTAAPESQL